MRLDIFSIFTIYWEVECLDSYDRKQIKLRWKKHESEINNDKDFFDKLFRHIFLTIFWPVYSSAFPSCTMPIRWTVHLQKGEELIGQNVVAAKQWGGEWGKKKRQTSLPATYKKTMSKEAGRDGKTYRIIIHLKFFMER